MQRQRLPVTVGGLGKLALVLKHVAQNIESIGVPGIDCQGLTTAVRGFGQLAKLLERQPKVGVSIRQPWIERQGLPVTGHRFL